MLNLAPEATEPSEVALTVEQALRELRKLRQDREGHELTRDELKDVYNDLLQSFLASEAMKILASSIETQDKAIGEISAQEAILRKSYGQAIYSWVREKVAGMKERTFAGECKLALRAIPRALKVTNEEAAIAWGETYAPETVRKSFLVSKLPKDCLAMLDSSHPDWSPTLCACVSFSDPAEVLTIDGVKLGDFLVPQDRVEEAS